jgi:hypothetical protein
MNFLKAVQTASAAERLFKAAGLDLPALAAAGDDSALAAHIESLVSAARQQAPAAAALTAEHPEVAALIAAALAPVQATLREQGLRATAIQSALAQAGIQLADTAPTAEIGATLAAGLKAQAAKEARALLAAKGFSAHALADAPAADPTRPAAKAAELTGRARTVAAFAAERAARAV